MWKFLINILFPITIGLISYCIGINYIDSCVFYAKFNIFLMKVSVPVAAFITAVSIPAYNYISDLNNIPNLEYRQLYNVNKRIETKLKNFWYIRILLIMLIVSLCIPGLFFENNASQYKIITVLIFSLELSVISYVFIQIITMCRNINHARRFKAYMKEKEHMERKNQEQIKVLRDGVKSGWKEDRHLDGFRK